MAMDFSMSSILGGLVFGVFGIYLLRLGKREGKLRPMIIGLTLMVFPYFVGNPWILWSLGAGLTVYGYLP